ncbi:hypothetical protein ACVWW5_002314 [Bradyrhizobium sp. LM3.4]
MGFAALYPSYALRTSSHARRHTPASSRRISPELCSLHRPHQKRAQGRPGAGWHPRSAVRGVAQKELHSGIQVKPNTRPSLRSGFTAYAVLSREPSSFWPPSPSRQSRTSRRLTRMPPPPRLDRSNDGQDHTVLPYAHSVARPHEASGSRRAIRPALDLSYTTLPRPPQPGPRFERLANRPSSSGRAVSTYAAIPNFGKVEYFRGEGLTGWRGVLPDGPHFTSQSDRPPRSSPGLQYKIGPAIVVLSLLRRATRS